MKTSNIIIIAFAAFIISGMLFLFIDAKKHKKEVENNISFKEFPLATFSVIVAEKGSDLHIDWSDSTVVKVEYLKDKKTPSKIYEVVNDTLRVYGGLRTFVKCKKIATIIGNKPFWVGVNNFTPDSLTIRMNGGSLYYDKDRGNKDEKLDQKTFNLGIIANDSAYVEINNNKLHNLSVMSDNAKVRNNCNVNIANIRLLDGAKFSTIDRIDILLVKKDISCQVGISYQDSY